MERSDSDSVGNGDDNIAFSIEDILNTWDLSAYVQNFLSNEFDASHIFALCEDINENALKDLIPIGSHRMRFKSNCRALLAAESETTVTKVPGSFEAKSSNSEVRTETNQDRTMESESSTTTSVLTNSNRSSSTGSDQLMKRKTSDRAVDSVAEKRRNTENTENTSPEESGGTSSSVPDKDLVKLLKETGSGNVLLSLAKKSKSLKQDKDIQKLCEIIIEKKILSSPNYKIHASEFPKIVESIKSLFPDENEDIYFIPYRKEGGVKCQAKGKLISKYYTLRKDLKAGGVISNNRGDDDDDDDNDDDNSDNDEPPVEGLQEKISFLQENTTPWEQVLSFWKDTARLRLSSIQKLFQAKPKKPAKGSKKDVNENNENQEVDSTVISYIASYPPLRTKDGFNLFESDFAKLYPNSTLKVYSDFDDFVKQAIKALSAIEKKLPGLQKNLEILEDADLSKEGRELLVLLSLSYLDSVVTVTKRKREGKTVTWRPPHSEIQEGFVAYVETPGKAHSFISKRFEKFSMWGLPVQPFVIACGPDIEDIIDCYVVISKDIKFNGFSSVKRALDVCFKIIHAVNAEYSCESYRLWMLIQKRLYGLDTAADKVKNDAQLPVILKRFDC